MKNTTRTMARPPLTSRRRWLFRLTAIGLALLISTIVMEVTLRVYVASRGWTPNCYITGDAFFIPDADSVYTLKPNLRIRSSALDVKVNSIGLRGPEISRSKPPGVTRIAVLGESSVFGYLAPEGLDSCRILERGLKELGLECEVLNAGVPGFKMSQSCARFKKDIAPLKPDIVIVYLGWNDSVYLFEDDPAKKLSQLPGPPSFFKRLLSNSTLYGLVSYRFFSPSKAAFAVPATKNSEITAQGSAAFKTNLEHLLDAIEQTGAQTIICTQIMAAHPGIPDSMRNYLDDGSKEQVDKNIRMGKWLAQVLREASQTHGCTLIDAYETIAPTPEMLGDAIHPTIKGHQRLAELWQEHVMRLLKH